MKTRFALMACLVVIVMACDRLPPAPTATTATTPDALPQTEVHAGYVPGNRIDALAVNCKLCDEWARQCCVTYEWDIAAPNDPVWIGRLMQAADTWEKMKAEHGPNSDEALVVRNELVRMRKIALGAAESYENIGRRGRKPLIVAEHPVMSLAEVVDLAEEILLDGGAVK